MKTIILAASLLLTSTMQADNVEDFVNRFYTEVLHRSADTAGLNHWSDELRNGNKTGEDIAHGFIFSNEYNLNAKSDEAYLQTLYKAFFNRAPDSAGLSFWNDALKKGTTKAEVLDGFLKSNEFTQLSQSFGITPAQPQNNVQGFVERFYTEVLDRTADNDGLSSWTSQLESHTLTGEDVARGFVQSQEFDNKGLDNETYVKTLYKSFFGREADEGGLQHWLNELNHGTSKDNILNGFLNSQEFKDLSDSYGIIATRDQRDNTGNNGDISVSFGDSILPILTQKCKACHGSNGRFTVTTSNATYANITSLKGSLSAGGYYLLDKSSNTIGHGGGQIIAVGSAEYTTIKDWIDASTTASAKITGTVPGTFVEAYCDDGTYASTTSVQNGTNQHPFSLTVPTNTPCRIVMTTNQNNPTQRVITPIQVNTQNAVTLTGDTDMGYADIPATYAEATDANGDHVQDSPINVSPTSLLGTAVDDSASNNPFDKDNNGHLDILEDANNNHVPDGWEDTNNNGKADIFDDSNNNGKPDSVERGENTNNGNDDNYAGDNDNANENDGNRDRNNENENENDDDDD